MPSKEKIEAVRDYIRETSGGHSLSRINGDLLWQTNNPINLTKALEAAEQLPEGKARLTYRKKK